MAITKDQALTLIGSQVAFTYRDGQYRRGIVQGVRTASTGKELLQVKVEGDFRSYDLTKISKLQRGDITLPKAIKRECEKRALSLRGALPVPVLFVHQGKIQQGVLLAADHMTITVFQESSQGRGSTGRVYPLDEITDIMSQMMKPLI